MVFDCELVWASWVRGAAKLLLRRTRFERPLMPICFSANGTEHWILGGQALCSSLFRGQILQSFVVPSKRETTPDLKVKINAWWLCLVHQLKGRLTFYISFYVVMH